MASQPAPGWYDDGTGKHRWWDGTRWSEEFIDLREERTALHHGAAPTGTGAAPPGWYDDQRGRHRWWDGRQWTSAVRYSGQEQAFAGIVLDGRWIHFGDLSQPIGGVEAAVEAGDALLRRPEFTRAAVERRLSGASGAISSRALTRAIPRGVLHLVVSGPQVWVVPVPTGTEPEARQFVSWVSASARHYRYG